MEKIRSVDKSKKKNAQGSGGGSLELMGHFFDAFWDVVVFVDNDGFIRKANKAVVKLSGYLASEIEGMPIEALVPDHLKNAHAYLRENYQRNPLPRAMGGELEIKLLTKSGDTRQVDISLQPFTIGDTSGVIVAIRDKQAIQQLESKINELENERAHFSQFAGVTSSDVASLIFASAAPAVVIDRAGYIKRVNYAFESSLVGTEFHRLGENFYDLISTDGVDDLLSKSIGESRFVGPIEINRAQSRINVGSSSFFVWPIHRVDAAGVDDILIQFTVEPPVPQQFKDNSSIATFVRQISQAKDIISFSKLASGEIGRVFSGLTLRFLTQDLNSAALLIEQDSISRIDTGVKKGEPIGISELSGMYLLDQISVLDSDYLMQQAFQANEAAVIGFECLASSVDARPPVAIALWKSQDCSLKLEDLQAVESYLSCIRSIFSINCAKWKHYYWNELFGAVNLGILVTDLQGKIIYKNHVSEALLGVSSALDEHSGIWLSCISCDTELFSAQFYEELATTKSFVQDGLVRQRRHASIPVRINAQRLSMSGKDVDALLVTLEDMTRLAEAQGFAAHLSNYDSLTNLPNIELATSRVNAILDSDKRMDLGVLVVHLDRLKQLRAVRGSQAGDDLVKKASARLVSRARLGEMVARIDTDEFAVICTGINTKAKLTERSEEFDALMRQPFESLAGEVYFTPQIGLAMAEDVQSAHELFIRAGIRTRNVSFPYLVGSPNDRIVDFSSLSTDIDVEMALHRAVAGDELEAHFQPQVSLATGMLVGAEALVRWRRPGYGLVFPGEFLNIAESVGLIGELGNIMLWRACEVLSLWESQGLDASVSVNISGSQLVSPTFVKQVRTIVDRTGVSPSRLILELTETAFIGDVDAALVPLRKLRDFGVRFSIDDFGTGYSSMTYLRKLPFSEMKLDQSFVSGVVTNSGDRAILASMIKLGESLGITTIAEGIEHQNQAKLLTEMGCQFAQGYYFGRPSTLDSLEWQRLLAFGRTQGLA